MSQSFSEFIKKCNESPCDRTDITCEECCWNAGREELKKELAEKEKTISSPT